MHALLAHAYHLAEYGLHVLLLPLWHPPLAALAIAAAGRIAGFARTPRGATLTACAAALAGWMLLDAGWTTWPPPPIARLPVLALILLAEMLPPRNRRLVPLALAALAAWWLRGAPTGAAALLGCVPVFLGLAIAFPLARRLARGDTGLGSAAAGLVLAAGIMLAGASVHWARAAIVPAVSALALLGVWGAGQALSGAIVVVAASAMVASDRGRLWPVDLACLAPLLVWPAAGMFRKAIDASPTGAERPTP